MQPAQFGTYPDCAGSLFVGRVWKCVEIFLFTHFVFSVTERFYSMPFILKCLTNIYQNDTMQISKYKTYEKYGWRIVL